VVPLEGLLITGVGGRLPTVTVRESVDEPLAFVTVRRTLKVRTPVCV
jgi:hypothetical protein